MALDPATRDALVVVRRILLDVWQPVTTEALFARARAVAELDHVLSPLAEDPLVPRLAPDVAARLGSLDALTAAVQTPIQEWLDYCASSGETPEAWSGARLAAKAVLKNAEENQS